MSVHQKLMQARIKLQNTKLNKSGNNKFANYQYFELGDFIPQVNSIFNEVGLCGVVRFNASEATLTITDVDGGGEIVITSPMADASLKGCHPVQNLGATQTYLRRYLWVTAMEIVEHDALDATTGQDESHPTKPIKPQSAKEVATKPVPFDYDAASDKMCAAKTEDELKAVFSVAWKHAKADGVNDMAKTIKAIYDEQKVKFEVAQ